MLSQILSTLVGTNFLYEGWNCKSKYTVERRHKNIEEKCGEEERKLTEEFEAQASVFLPSLYLRL